jgi:hypothetical protein
MESDLMVAPRRAAPLLRPVLSDKLEEEGAGGGVVLAVGGPMLADEELAGGEFKSEEAKPVEGVG